MLIKSALFCLALNVYYEARGEPVQGQLAVAHVTLNRVKENKSSICKEVFKKKQFSWTNQSYRIPNQKDQSWIKAQRIARSAINSQDNTQGAIYFHSKKCKNTALFKKKKMTKYIGNHIFYANR